MSTHASAENERSNLVGTLAAAGMHAETWSSPDGSSVAILPRGGRILGLFAEGSRRNFFWTHPELDRPETARAFYAADLWHNSGGDRTWLTPEIDLFLPNYPSTSTYVQPPGLEENDYLIAQRGTTLTLQRRCALHLTRPNANIEVEITKRISAAQNPLRLQGSKDLDGLTYAGYTLRTRLQIISSSLSDPVQIGLWALLQLPFGGEFLIPTYGRAETIIYMGPINSSLLQVSKDATRYLAAAPGELKLGIDSTFIKGRVGYLHSDHAGCVLIIRNFFCNPSGNYVDVPAASPSRFGCAVQVCSIQSGLGSFAELEHHSPATGESPGDETRVDESQIWAFRGSFSAIREAARRLLGIAI